MRAVIKKSRSHRRRISDSYIDLIKSLGPIAYWPLDETAGAVAHCLVNPAQNGTYTGVTLANDATGPFGTAAPFFDGANDYIDILTAALQAAVNASVAELTIAIWYKIGAVGVWADGASRYATYIARPGGNGFFQSKHSVNNQWRNYWSGGGVVEENFEAGLSQTGWTFSTMTRSESADEIRYYRNGAWLATDVTIGNMAAGAWTTMIIGASSVVPASVWHGWLAHCALWDRVLGADTLLALATP